MMFKHIAERVATSAVVLAAAVTLSGCSDLLSVENPGAIDEGDVTDPVFVPQMMNAVVAEFQSRHAFLAYAGAVFTVEAVTGHNFTQWEDIDLRIIEDDNSQLLVIYQNAQTARAVGDDMVRRLREVVPNPDQSLELATALAYSGYSYVRLGEMFCYAPVDPESNAIQSSAILELAVQQFDEAIRIGQAAGTGAAAQRTVNLARVGAARASLQQGKMQEAIAYASQVPAGFVAHVRHATTPTTLRNYYNGETTGTNRTIGVDVAFRGLNDPRVRHTQASTTGHNQKTRLFTPAKSPAFGGWAAVPMNISDANLISQQGIAQDTEMVLASYLEARYILAEAGGMTEAELRAFINSRRTVGQQGAFTGTDLMAELRDQRRRDFFLGGHRLADLRRYKELYGVDQFPSGPHPNAEAWGWGSYGSATCFIPHRNEGVGNPNYNP